jgi:hypothetical protein
MRKNCGCSSRTLQRKKKSKPESVCNFAKIEFFHDETARRKLLTIVWSCYRIIHPGLIPWDLGQHMLDVNPLDDDHVLFNKCHGAFWTRDYFTDLNAGSSKANELYILCRKHDELEIAKHMNTILLMQLGGGFFSQEDWAHIVTFIAEKAATAAGSAMAGDFYEGSHLCHNGVRRGIHCRNIFCMIWESCVNNPHRKPCHTKFLKLQKESNGTDSEMKFTCFPGVTIPCKARVHETKDTIRSTVLDIFGGVQNERNEENKRTNKYGRCPFPDCGIELVTTISSLAPYLPAVAEIAVFFSASNQINRIH